MSRGNKQTQRNEMMQFAEGEAHYADKGLCSR